MNKKYAVTIALNCLLGAILVDAIFAEPFEITTRSVLIRDCKLGTTLSGASVVLLSDVHMASVGHRERSVLRILDHIEPDAIFLAGDFVRWGGDYEPALSFLSELKAKNGVRAVMGDYDYSPDTSKLRLLS